jgi:cellulose synthase/poly-beta-1,6-N-acetylglucosamine synthase-like glycosyltransferase
MTLSDWMIAIPSYKRQDTLIEQTLATLKHYKIPPSRITVFVADKEEKKLYEEAIPKGAV